jgi:hypothetical protein
LGLGLFPAYPCRARAETYKKLVQPPLFMVLNTGIIVLRKLRFKNLQKILFGEGQVQDPVPALPGHGSKIAAVFLGGT